MARILLIEDDDATLKLYTEVLKKEGWSVSQYKTGNIIPVTIKNFKPDIILLDIMLPGKRNGFDILEDVKRDEDLKKIPVIVLTNLDSEKKVAIEIGAEDYIVKANTSIQEIVKKVKKFLRG